MDGGSKWDLARQVANVVGAIFQVGATVSASVAIQEVADRGPVRWSSRLLMLSRFGL